VTAAQIRDAARLVGADATAENVLDRTDQVAEIWVAGFIAGLLATEASAQHEGGVLKVPLRSIRDLLTTARHAEKTVGTP
jgi:uncharacterized protein YgfB (UPF0149 family)